jgi:hypothetical protein
MTLAASREILTRNKEGQASLRLVNTELYSRDAGEWRNAIYIYNIYIYIHIYIYNIYNIYITQVSGAMRSSVR